MQEAHSSFRMPGDIVLEHFGHELGLSGATLLVAPRALVGYDLAREAFVAGDSRSHAAEVDAAALMPEAKIGSNLDQPNTGTQRDEERKQAC